MNQTDLTASSTDCCLVDENWSVSVLAIIIAGVFLNDIIKFCLPGKKSIKA